MLDAKGALCLAQHRLEEAKYQRQSAFNELHLLEASMGSLHERRNFAGAQASDPDLTEATDEEIEAWATRLSPRCT